MNHVRYRSYIPELGRWNQRDLLGYPDGMNSYHYAGGNPIDAATATR